MKRILAVDGNSIINRAYFGVRPLTNDRGQRTEAIYGMLNILFSQIEKYGFDSIQVAFDLPAPTFRHKMYDLYKSNRHGMEEDLARQMEPAQELLRALGCKVLMLEGYEADDILGTVAQTCRRNGDECYILTGDRDSLQLISDRIFVLLAGKETVLYDRALFKERYGIFPEQFVDAKALMGDSSDCIPGVPGIGEKTALPLIAQFGSLDGVYGHLDDPSIKAGQRAKLESGKESAYLSQSLARIYTEVPLSLDFSPVVRRNDLYERLEELGFSSFISRLGLKKEEAAAAPLDASEAEKTVYTPKESPFMRSLSGEMGVSFADQGLYVSSKEGDYFFESPEKEDLAVLFNGKGKIAAYDVKTLYHRLFSLGIDGFCASDDPMLAAYVLSSAEKDYLPATLYRKYLGIPCENEDAALTLRLARVLNEKLASEGALKLYREVELPTARVLARCEEEGFLIDREGIARFGQALEQACKEQEEEIYALAGGPFNVNSPKQLGQVLYDRLGLTVYGMKKTKNGYTTNAETLEKLRSQHPIVEAILSYRQLSKLRSTYTEGLLKAAGEDGRVHTSFTQTVTATGRLSSVEPNLQNIPVRTQLGRELRRFFIAPEGRVLIDADYSQIELRVLAHISHDETMIDAFKNNVDIHAVTASQVFGVPMSMVTPEMRKRAKAVNFGIVYGISAFSLSDDIKVSRKEAEKYIEGYFETYPGIERYMKSAVEAAKEQGFVSSLYGRKRQIPELSSGKAVLRKFGERVAMNSPIQGTAADIIKIAMVRADRALEEAGLDARLILQVHDELIVEASEKDADRAAQILRREMENAVDLTVPLTVDLHAGKTWFECK